MFGLVIIPVAPAQNSVALRHARYGIGKMLRLGEGEKQEHASCETPHVMTDALLV